MKDDIIIRRAELRDMKAVFDLNNDAVVRATSIHTKPIAWDGHQRWFANALLNSSLIYFIVETVDGRFAGEVRLAYEEGNWVITIHLSEGFRGKGIGVVAIRQAIKQSQQQSFVAYVKHSNKASLRMFEKIGFSNKGVVKYAVGGEAVELVRFEHKVLRRKEMELIGEIGTNHNGDLNTAIKLIEMAARTGLDTVKFQIYDAEDIVSPLVTPGLYGISCGYSFWKDYINDKLITPKAWLKDLVQCSKDNCLDVLATVHSAKNAEACLNAGIKRLKIASMDCNNYPLIQDVSSMKVPVCLSTGMSTLREIVDAVEIIKRNNCDLTLFHCVATYPSYPEEANLSFLKHLSDLGPSHLGLSDHSETNEMVLMSIPFGVDVIEKHITLDKSQQGPDHPFALDEAGCRLWRMSVDNALKCIGTGEKRFSDRELKNRRLYRRVAIAKYSIPEGTPLSLNDVCLARPDRPDDHYVQPGDLSKMIGVPLTRSIGLGEGLTYRHFTRA